MPEVSATAGLTQTADPLWLALAMPVTGHKRSFTQQRYTYSALPYRDSSNVNTAALKMDENSTVTGPRSVSTSAVTLRAICFIG
jgi:hypothetical protein